jgi:hypothetical protein
MSASVAIPLTCWVCAFIATPRKPRVGNEVAELVYARLLSRQHRVVLLALIVTMVTFVAQVLEVPHALLSDQGATPETVQICADAEMPSMPVACYRQGAGGTRVPDPADTTPAWDPRLVIDPPQGNG